MSHHTECSLLVSLSCHSLCEGYYKYNCLTIVTGLRYSQDILYFCKRRNEGSRKGQVSVCHQELLIMKCLPINSLEHIPQLTLRPWRHELSPGPAVRPVDHSHLECKGMLKCWPSPSSVSQPSWEEPHPNIQCSTLSGRQKERKAKTYCSTK